MPLRDGPSRGGFARVGRAAGAPYGTVKPLPRKQQEQQQQRMTPACEQCVGLMECTQRVRHSLEEVLENAKMLFLDDTLHHQMDDERWIRVLRALGEDKSKYFARIVSLRSIEQDD